MCRRKRHLKFYALFFKTGFFVPFSLCSFYGRFSSLRKKLYCIIFTFRCFRFKSKLVRCLASFSYVIRSLLNVSVTVFTPCVALKTVIGLPYWASICGITAISIVFALMVIEKAPTIITKNIISLKSLINRFFFPGWTQGCHTLGRYPRPNHDRRFDSDNNSRHGRRRWIRQSHERHLRTRSSRLFQVRVYTAA